MGDISETKTETTDKTSSSQPDLPSGKPSETSPVVEKPTVQSELTVLVVDDLEAVDSHKKVETFFEKALDDAPSFVQNSEKPSDTKIEQVTEEVKQPANHKLEDEKDSVVHPPKERVLTSEKKPRISSAASELVQSERIIRNQSDIFSLKEQTSIASAIFSVNGSPSRKVFRKKELPPNNVFPCGEVCTGDTRADTGATPKEKVRDTRDSYNELRRPSSSVRNPLTGTGLSSNDEYKFKGSKRKDGNPLLGLGYSPEATPSTHRIPPGGFSHKLW